MKRPINKLLQNELRHPKGKYKPIPLAASVEIGKAIRRIYKKYHGKISNDGLYLLTVDAAFHERIWQNTMGSF